MLANIWGGAIAIREKDCVPKTSKCSGSSKSGPTSVKHRRECPVIRLELFGITFRLKARERSSSIMMIDMETQYV
jgi:hypothetical protein